MNMNKKGFANITLVVVIVVILVGAVGYFAFVKKPALPETQNTTLPTSNNNNVPQNPAANETANWKTYRSEQYGFEFRHPTDWQSRVLKEGSIDDIVQVFSPESYAIAVKGDSDRPTDQFAVRILYNKAYDSKLEGTNITFAGKNAVDGGWKTSAMGVTPLRIIKILVDPLITIEMSAPSSGSQKTEEQILSTFKFIK